MMLDIRFAQTADREAIRELLQQHPIDASGWRLPLAWWLGLLDMPLAAPADPKSLAPDEPVLLVAHSGGGIVAVASFTPAFGTRKPCPAWRLGRTVHASEDLNILHAVDTLQLSHDLHGSSELAVLAMLPDLMSGTAPSGLLDGLLHLLKSALAPSHGDALFMRLRGVHTPDGGSPFWQALGRPFCPPALSRIDTEGAIPPGLAHWKSGVAELLPRLAVYGAFLPDDVQHDLGRTDPALASFEIGLECLGFRASGLIDLIDAGPMFTARWKDVDTRRAA
ncbi:MAG TPA: arginine N-succinyltransferase [Burkholderiaceae bacterium]|nr:arginine N-succinyltransferase [Burkholderiaceae bacterium]